MLYLIKSVIGTVILIIIAVLGYFYTPKSMSAFGYKTPMSMKNEQTWLYANGLTKKLFVAIVIVFIAVEVLFYLFFFKDDYFAAYGRSFTILTILSLLFIPAVEIMLNLKFDKNGKLKKKDR